MEKVIKFLRAYLFGALALALLIILVFECDAVAPGILGGDKAAEFPVLMSMELITLLLIPLALYLFHMKIVHAALQSEPEQALRKWGFVRLSLLNVLLVANIVCYYLYMSASFGYLAFIAAICLIFVYPSKDRCARETALEEGDDNDLYD